MPLPLRVVPTPHPNGNLPRTLLRARRETAALRDFGPAYVAFGVRLSHSATSAQCSGLPESGRRCALSRYRRERVLGVGEWGATRGIKIKPNPEWTNLSQRRHLGKIFPPL